ncbi:MAG TPA: site-2 protease family protein [Blastocatellia bacterium]|nr:site-2 protease family protein [Blastocatellia bacterium]
MESNIKLGKLFGIEIGVSYSWFIIFFLITFSLWSNYAALHSHWPSSWHLVAALTTSLLFFASLLFHELSHSLLALAKGLPVHSITLFIFGGVSRIEKEAMNASTEFWVGVIGPISSAVLAGFFYLISQLVGDPASPLGAMTGWLALINLGLALFNLIPGFPLDGGRVLRAAVWGWTGSLQNATRIASLVGQGFAYLFIIVGILLALRENVVGGLWMAFIGWFLLDAARSSQQAMVFERAMKGARAIDVMSSDVPAVTADLTLSEFVDEHVIRTGRRCFIVLRDGHMLGIVTPHEVKSVSREQWPFLTVEQVMKPFDSMSWVEPNTDLHKVLELMDSDDVNQVPVVARGHLEGIIRREHLLRFIKTRVEFDY